MKSHGFCSLQLTLPSLLSLYKSSPSFSFADFPWLPMATDCNSLLFPHKPIFAGEISCSLFQVNKGKGVNTLGDPWMTLKSKLLT